MSIRYFHNTNSDLSQLLVEEDGTTTTKYVYGNELISAKVYNKSLEELKQEGQEQKTEKEVSQASQTYYYHYDNLKSTTLLTDETGRVVETYDYGTYGEVMEGDTTLTRFLYNGGLGVSSDSTGLYYMRARYYNPVIRRFINQDVETGSMDNSASLNRYAYVQGNPVSLTDPFGLSPDMEYGSYEANALKALYKVADKVADYLPVVGTARDIKRSYNAFKNGNIADGIKHGATAALSLAVPTAKLATKAMKTTLKLAKNALKAEKCMSKTAEIATEGIRLAGKAGKTGRLAEKAGSVSAKIAKSVKNGVSTVARTVKTNGAKVFKKERKRSVGNKNDARGLLSDYLGKSVNKELGSFYSIKNKMGGEVFVSTQGIVQSDIIKVVSQTKGEINIISGRHGDWMDNVKLEPKFYLDDVEKFGRMPNVNVFDFSKISSKEIESLINSEDTTILGWCFSEYFSLMREAFK